jgi:hypothetical protein
VLSTNGDLPTNPMSDGAGIDIDVIDSEIRFMVDIYVHLIPGANVSFVDQLDEVPVEETKTSRLALRLRPSVLVQRTM